MRRRRVKNRFFGRKAFLGVSTFLIFVLFFLLLKSGLFNIRSVEVSTDLVGCADESQIRNSSGLLGQNFFLLNQKGLAETLRRRFVCVKDVSLSKVFPDRARVKVSGRQSAATLISLKDQFASSSALIENIATPSASDIMDSFVVDSEGVVFSQNAESLNTPRIFVTGLNLSLGKNLAGKFLDALKILDKVKTLGLTIRESFLTDNFFAINLEDGPKIIFRLDDKIDVQLGSLQLIWDKAKINRRTIPPEVGINTDKIEFIDLRFDKPVVRYGKR